MLNDFGKPVARIVPHMPTITVSPGEARAGILDNKSILAGIVEAREDESAARDADAVMAHAPLILPTGVASKLKKPTAPRTARAFDHSGGR